MKNSILHTPLSDEEADILNNLRIGLFRNPHTKQWYVHRSQWLYVPERKRENIATMLEVLRKQEGVIPVNKLLEIEKLYERGYSLILFQFVGKNRIPVVSWKAYQDRRASLDDIRSWFGNGKDYNVGIVTGALSGIVVVDIDGPEIFDRHRLPKTPVVKTGKGYHYWFKHPGFRVGNFVKKIPGVDFRGDGGFVAAPPSAHYEPGKQYQWEVSPDDAALAEMPPWLLALVEKPAADNDNVIEKTTAYGSAALAEECAALAKAEAGQRNDLLNVAACKAANLIAGGHLRTRDARLALVQACSENGLVQDDGIASVQDTISSGFQRGLLSPRGPEEGSAKPQATSLTLLRASDIKPERIDWLWKGVLAKGKPTILASDPGLGKSQVSLNIAATITSGKEWPASTTRATPGNVIILNCEDGSSDTIVPRLTAAGADLNRCFIVSGARDMKRDIPQLGEVMEAIGGCSLIVVDPISAYMGGLDINNSGDVRSITNELTAFAEKHGASVLLLHHLNKSADKKASYRLIGSQAWQGAARMVYIIERDGENPDRRVMAPSKNNLAMDNVAFFYSVKSAEVPSDSGAIETSHVAWEVLSDRKTADQALIEKGDGGVALNEAKEVCREIMKNGRVESTKANKAVAAFGIAESTLKRAKRDLRIVGVTDDNITWYWDYKPDRAAA